MTVQVKELRQEQHVRGHSTQYGECWGELTAGVEGSSQGKAGGSAQ